MKTIIALLCTLAAACSTPSADGYEPGEITWPLPEPADWPHRPACMQAHLGLCHTLPAPDVEYGSGWMEARYAQIAPCAQYADWVCDSVEEVESNCELSLEPQVFDLSQCQPGPCYSDQSCLMVTTTCIDAVCR